MSGCRSKCIHADTTGKTDLHAYAISPSHYLSWSGKKMWWLVSLLFKTQGIDVGAVRLPSSLARFEVWGQGRGFRRLCPRILVMELRSPLVKLATRFSKYGTLVGTMLGYDSRISAFVSTSSIWCSIRYPSKSLPGTLIIPKTRLQTEAGEAKASSQQSECSGVFPVQGAAARLW